MVRAEGEAFPVRALRGTSLSPAEARVGLRGTRSRQISGACAESVTPQGPDPHPGVGEERSEDERPSCAPKAEGTWCSWARRWAISRPGRPKEKLACRLYLCWAQATCCRPVSFQKHKAHLIQHPAQASCPSLCKIFHE